MMHPVPLPASGEYECPIEQRHTVPALLPDTLLATGAPVLASAVLIALCEHACWQLLRPHLTSGEVTLGCGFSMHHRGPAWPGEHLSITTTITDTDQQHRSVTFRCAAHVGQRLVGELDHHARVVDRAAWMAAARPRGLAVVGTSNPASRGGSRTFDEP